MQLIVRPVTDNKSHVGIQGDGIGAETEARPVQRHAAQACSFVLTHRWDLNDCKDRLWRLVPNTQVVPRVRGHALQVQTQHQATSIDRQWTSTGDADDRNKQLHLSNHICGGLPPHPHQTHNHLLIQQVLKLHTV